MSYFVCLICSKTVVFETGSSVLRGTMCWIVSWPGNERKLKEVATPGQETVGTKPEISLDRATLASQLRTCTFPKMSNYELGQIMHLVADCPRDSWIFHCRRCDYFSNGPRWRKCGSLLSHSQTCTNRLFSVWKSDRQWKIIHLNDSFHVC